MFGKVGIPEKKLLLGTLYLRYFGLVKVPMLFFIRPRLIEWTSERVVFKVPLARPTRNHLGCMYFGALAAGADLAAGFAAVAAIRDSGEPVSFVFKNVQGEFLKRAEGDAHFTCTDTFLVTDLVQKAIETGERVELPIPVTVTVPTKLKDEPVARFVLTLSLKRQVTTKTPA